MARPTREQFTAYEYMYKYFNRSLFNNSLPAVILNFSRHANSYGFFAAARWHHSEGASVSHEISINPAHLATRPPRDTASTLVHEMCHLWQQENGSPPRRGYHDREWAEKMQSVGLQPIDPKTGADRMSAHKLTHRIVEGGPFAEAFERMPRDYLLPWQCSELEPRKKGGKEGEGEGGGKGARNKTKYTCPGCATNVWGKPELVIICGPCGEPFQLAAESHEQTAAAA